MRFKNTFLNFTLTATFLLATQAMMPQAFAAKAPAGLSRADETFIALKEAASKGNAARIEQLAAQLPKSHVLHSFAEYWKFRLGLESASEASILAFMNQYPNTFVADRLRNDWLLLLGKRGDWKRFDEQFPLFALQDDAQLDCYAQNSALARNDASFSVDKARVFLTRNASVAAGAGCMALTEAMAVKQVLTPSAAWAQLHILAEGKRNAALERLTDLPPKVSEANVRAAYASPATWLAKNKLNTSNAELYAYALANAARTDLASSESTIALANVLSTAAPEAAARVWIQGLAACGQKQATGVRCSDWLGTNAIATLPNNVLGLGTDNALEWAVRAVLREQNWVGVQALIERLPAHLAAESAWQYWGARAAQALAQGNTAAAAPARSQFANIAHRYDFYGILAREALGQQLNLLSLAPKKPAAQLDAEVNAILQKPEIARMQAFYSMGMRFEGNREWNWMLRNATDDALQNFAEAGRRLGYTDRMINSSERTKAAHDFYQRFPMPYINEAAPVAKNLGLDTAWVYGLIRQESRFITSVYSSVGAQGLMQLMPKTAAWVSKKIGANIAADEVLDPVNNLLLGQHYLNMVQNDLDGSPMLATAAYNAGPGRPRAWRATLPRATEGAIFAETIIFNETRTYVKSVLANAVIYATLYNKERGEKSETNLTKRLGVVAPKSAGVTVLP